MAAASPIIGEEAGISSHNSDVAMLSLVAAALSFAPAPLANRVVAPQAGASLTMSAKSDLEGAPPRPAAPVTPP